MGMVVFGSGIDSAECRELRAKLRERVQQYDDMDATLVFDTEDAFIEYQNNGRSITPYLMLMGRPVSLQGDFPYGVSGVEYSNKLDQQLVSYRYELTRENLADLALKGLFEPGFEPPQVLRKNRFELPCTISCAALGPQSESDFPVIFASLNPGSLVCDDNMSGYSIHEYFDALPEREPDDLVYESAVSRMLPYDAAFSNLGSELQIHEKSDAEILMEQAQEQEQSDVPADDELNAPDVQDTGELSKPDGLVIASEKRSEGVVGKPMSATVQPVVKPETKPETPVSKPVEPIDRKQAISEMGGPEEDDCWIEENDNELE